MQIRWSGERPDIGGVVYSAGRDCVIKVWNPKDGAMLILGFGEVLNLLKVLMKSDHLNHYPESDKS